jgi:hypothetical protein
VGPRSIRTVRLTRSGDRSPCEIWLFWSSFCPLYTWFGSSTSYVVVPTVFMFCYKIIHASTIPNNNTKKDILDNKNKYYKPRWRPRGAVCGPLAKNLHYVRLVQHEASSLVHVHIFFAEASLPHLCLFFTNRLVLSDIMYFVILLEMVI